MWDVSCKGSRALCQQQDLCALHRTPLQERLQTFPQTLHTLQAREFLQNPPQKGQVPPRCVNKLEFVVPPSDARGNATRLWELFSSGCTASNKRFLKQINSASLKRFV